MAFVQASLLLGGLLAAIPVILHLVLRQQPKRVVFPALRFLKERRESNRRELQLRHWLLLALRCGLIALAALAMTRPSVAAAALGDWLLTLLIGSGAVITAVSCAAAHSQKRGRSLVIILAVVATALLVATIVAGFRAWFVTPPAASGGRAGPIAASLVIDTGPRMAYRHRNQTRLELAQETSVWLMKRLPADAQLAVLDSRPGPAYFAVDRSAAQSMLERLRVTGLPETMPDTIARAIDLVTTSPNPRREIFAFSDGSRHAWPDEGTQRLRAKLEQHPDVSLYLIDIGADQPRNVALGDIQLSSETLIQSGELVLQIDVDAVGFSGTADVELWLEKSDPTRPVVVNGVLQMPAAVARDRRSVDLASSHSQRVEFRLSGLEPGVQQGYVRLTTEDSLPVDNTRYFTIEVRDSWPVLLVSPTEAESFLISEALAPFEQREAQTARFSTRRISPADLANQDLAPQAAVCLVDPPPLTPPQWEQLGQYVERGGNVAIFLGHDALDARTFNEPAAQRILGGKLARVWRAADRELFLSPQRFDHPALALFRSQSSAVPWPELPVFRHWVFEDLAPQTSVLMEYSNGKPALVERSLGAGRVLIATTPWGEPANTSGRTPWNELLSGENPWPTLVLLNESLRYLVSGGESRLNYQAGETASLVNDPNLAPERYQLFPPSDDPQEVVADQGRLSVPFTEQPGAYRLKGQRGGPVVRGFAVNVAATASDVRRLDPAKLAESLGKDRVKVTRNRDEIVLEVGEARAGREFFPYLLLAVAVMLGLEQLLANRFYSSREQE